MEAKKFYTLEEIEDKYIGEKGTPKRDAYEEELNSFLIGEAIKQARQSKNLTQEELGNLIGVQRAQISRIENGKNLTFSTIGNQYGLKVVAVFQSAANTGGDSIYVFEYRTVLDT